ncbi:hypothetical protein KAR91_28660 [Candidatus Pacearchaeota archaeon]|nr:hypothetical protein [Candidatus Pacearchaeota archaeon]
MSEKMNPRISDETTDGSIPIKEDGKFVDSPLEINEEEDRIDSSKAMRLPTGSLEIGNQLKLDDATGALIYKRNFDNQVRICLTVGFDDTGTIQLPFTTDFNPKEIRDIIQPDDIGEITDTEITTTFPATANQFVSKVYYKVGTIVPADPINFKLYIDSISQENLVVDQIVQSVCPTPLLAGGEFCFDLSPLVGLLIGQTFISVFSSDSAFSFQADVINTTPWAAVDRQTGTSYRVLDESDSAVFLDRANHTGTQPASTISDFDDEVENNSVVDANKTHSEGDGTDHSGLIPAIEKGAPLGVAQLGTDGKVPSAQIPAVAITEVYSVVDIAARDALTIGPGDGEIQKGDTVLVADASADPLIISGPGGYQYNGSAYILFKSGDDVLSINSQTGFVLLTTDTIPEGLNLYFPEAPNDGKQYSRKSKAWAETTDTVTGWISGLDVTENSPKDTAILYGAGTYKIEGISKAVTPAGAYNLANGYLSVDHYSGMVDDQHALVTLCVDVDEVIKSIRGDIGEKGEVIFPPVQPFNSVCIAIVEIKVDGSDNPKDIDNKHITDERNKTSINTDETVSVSADDQSTGYLADKITLTGNITGTIVPDVDGKEVLNLDVPAGSVALPSILYEGITHIDGMDVAGLYPAGILWVDSIADINLQSLQNGQDKQMIHVVNLSLKKLRFENNNGTFESMIVEGNADLIADKYGGGTIIFNASKGNWYLAAIS